MFFMQNRLLSVLMLLALFAAIILLVWRVWPDQRRDDQAKAGASIYPLAYLLERLTNEAVFLVTPSGVEPHDFEASPQDLVSLRSMDLFVYNGAGLDAWAERIAPQLTASGVLVVDMAQSLIDRSIVLRSVETEEEGEHAEDGHDEDEADHEHEHESGSIDPHIWLDPQKMEQQARVITSVLIELRPEWQDDYRARLDLVLADLSQLDQDYAQGLASCRVRTIIASHDAFGYLADHYDFEVLPLSGISPQQEPSARRLGELATIVREQGIRYVFFETLVSPKLAQTLADEAGAQTLVLNPVEGLTAAEREQGEDYLTVMRKNLASLRTAMDCR